MIRGNIHSEKTCSDPMGSTFVDHVNDFHVRASTVKMMDSMSALVLLVILRSLC